jgi:phosphatidylinositol alpha-1,6-mannosyltransferase
VPVRFLGRVPDDDLPELYGCSDVFAMVCRNRWLGLEQEGFGIVFLEAAAAGVPQLAGTSGGSDEAVVDGETGLVIRDPRDPAEVARGLLALFDDAERRRDMGAAARRRAETEFSYDVLARRLRAAIDGMRA